jgi:phosphate-selective porin OprO and OprP
MALVLFAPGAAAFAQQEAPKADQEKPQPPAEPPIAVSLKDGVHFKSADGNLDSTLGGYASVHYRFTAHRPKDNVRSSPDSWFLRQVRPELAGTIYKDFEFKIQYEFATGATSAVVGTLQDAYLGWKYLPELSFRVGQFKEPFGQEQGISDRFVDFAERSIADRFTPARDLGAMVYGKLFDDVLGYDLGHFNGNGRGVVDSNKGKEFAGRIRVQPFVTADESSFFKYLRVGVAGTTGTTQKSSSNGLDSVSPYLGITVLDATAGTLDGDRKRLGGEVTWNYGPLGLRGEAWRRVDGLDNGAFNNERLNITAWNASVTYLLTGEKKPIEGRVVPTNDLNPRTGEWGAVEAAVRVDRLRISDRVFTTGVAPAAGNSNAATGYTFGMNWYLTRHIRISPNLFWEVYEDPILFSTGRTDRHFFGGILRFQLEF